MFLNVNLKKMKCVSVAAAFISALDYAPMLISPVSALLLILTESAEIKFPLSIINFTHLIMVSSSGKTERHMLIQKKTSF